MDNKDYKFTEIKSALEDHKEFKKYAFQAGNGGSDKPLVRVDVRIEINHADESHLITFLSNWSLRQDGSFGCDLPTAERCSRVLAEAVKFAKDYDSKRQNNKGEGQSSD